MVALAQSAAEILIFDEIGLSPDGNGLSAAQFDADLKALGPVTAITLRINSPGGDVYEGVAIYNTLKNHPAEITARIDGVAASAASLIAMAADRIEMPANAFFLVHEPRIAVALGTASDLTKAAADLQVMNDAFVSAYVDRTGQAADAIRALMAEDRLMSAAEAKTLGFADEITDAVKLTASYQLNKLPEKARAVVARAFKGPRMTQRARASSARADGDNDLDGLKKQMRALAKKLAELEKDGDEDEETSDTPQASDDDGQSDADTTARASDDEDNGEDEGKDGDAGDGGDDDEKPEPKGKAKGKAKARASRTFATGQADAFAYAQQVTETCNLAGHPEKAAAFIRDRKPLADIRSDLLKAQASGHTGIAGRHSYGGLRGTPSTASAVEDEKGWDRAIAKTAPRARAKAGRK